MVGSQPNPMGPLQNLGEGPGNTDRRPDRLAASSSREGGIQDRLEKVKASLQAHSWVLSPRQDTFS